MRHILCIACASVLAGAPASRAEPHWAGAVGSPGLNGAVRAMCVFDDGSGPALIVAGQFTMAGGAPASRIARWDGLHWSPLGDGLDGAVYALHTFDDGSGSGPSLYIGGNFNNAGAVPASFIARWDGEAYSAVGGGVTCVSPPTDFSPGVSAFCTWDEDGPGPLAPALFVGGSFSTAGGQAVRGLGRWRNGAWEEVGGGVRHAVNALRVHDDGSGPALFAGGTVLNVGPGSGLPTGYIARWNGAAWSNLLSGLDAQAMAFASLPNDNRLYMAGTFGRAVQGPNMHFAGAWTGAAWQALGSGLVLLGKSIAAFDARDGAGPNIYAGGHFDMHRWNGGAWTQIPGPTGAPWHVYSLCVYDDGLGAGPALYVGGQFGGVGVNIASLRGAPPCPGDANGDLVVNFADLNIVLAAFGQVGPGLPGDLDGDGVVSFADLNAVLSAFGSSC